MIRAIEPRVCAQMQEVGFFDAVEKILTIVLLSFLFVAAADTLSNAQTVSNDPNPFQSYTQAFATSSPSCVYNSQQRKPPFCGGVDGEWRHAGGAMGHPRFMSA